MRGNDTGKKMQDKNFLLQGFVVFATVPQNIIVQILFLQTEENFFHNVCVH